jgi:hypothetical protein
MRTTASLLGLAVIAFASVLGAPAEAQVASPPTFTKDVAPVLYKHCVTCHRPGEVAPMSLLTYEQSRPYAKAIANAISKRTMPPWHADAPAGTFLDERVLTDAERETIVRWASAGAPRGEAKDLPLEPRFNNEWALGTPDVVLEMLEDFPVAPSGTIEYSYFYVPTNFTERKWVKSFEVRPGNRGVVHHILLNQLAKVDTARTPLARGNRDHQTVVTRGALGERPQRADRDNMSPRLIATYAPGTNPQVAPEGTAFLIEPGSILEFQVHYTANGKAASDRSRVGLVFSKDPSPRELRAQAFFNSTLRLPPEAPDVAVTTELEFVRDSVLWGVFPHTHLRGKRWDYKLQLPDGQISSVLTVPRYDFNWQTYYMFRRPLQVPKGSKLISTAWYDNSSANKSNPDPKIEVLWGNQTWEEMQYTGVLLSEP